jgi:hypothetical protein
MKTLIAVLSYDGDAGNGSHDVIRETWGKDVAAAGAELRFFVGRRGPEFCPKRDETCIPWQQNRTCNHPFFHSQEGCCEDFWQFLTKEIIRWGLNRAYDFTFLCENDTFLIPQKLMQSGFEKFDFCGSFRPVGIPLGTKTPYEIYGHPLYAWPDPGVGYFVSEKAARVISNARLDHWSVGMYAGQVLGPGIELGEIKAMNFPEDISWHYREVKGKGYTTPLREGHQWMREMYRNAK